MSSDSVTIYTSIKPQLKRFVLLRGTLIALAGVALIVYAGAFLGPSTLNNWGLAIFLSGAFFIALGLIPYKRVARIEEAPNKIIVTDRRQLHYYRHGKDVWTLPLEAIEQVVEIDEPGFYGIGLKLSSEYTGALPKLSIIGEIYARGIRSRHRVDVIFPYFSRHSYRELEETVRLEK